MVFANNFGTNGRIFNKDNFSYNSHLENHSPEIYFRLNQDNAKWPRKPYFPEKIISNKWKYFKFLITYAHLKQ